MQAPAKLSDPASRTSMFGFVLRMLAYYGIFHLLYFLIPMALLHDSLYPTLFGHPTASIVNGLIPGEAVVATANRIASTRAVLEIVRGCDGSGVLFLIVAAVLAFPTAWRMRLIGVLLGAALVYLLNLARLAGLYVVASYRLSWFLPLHTYFVPSLLIVAMALFYLAWLAHAAPREEH